MQLSHGKIRFSLILALLSGAISGCDTQDPSGASDGRWFDSGGAELVYDAQIRMDAINAGKDQFAADKSCEAMLPMARKSLADANNGGTDIQIMYKTCNDAGLKFQNEVRCEADRLQVLCR